MQWVDHETYFGPDRRNGRRRLRLLERRRENRAGPPPALGTALRKFRMHVLDASGPRANTFIDQALALAQLAEAQDEPQAADELSLLAAIAARARRGERDMRPALYDRLGRVEMSLRVHG